MGQLTAQLRKGTMTVSYLVRAVAGVLAVLALGEVAVRALALADVRHPIPDPDLGWVTPAGTVVRWGREGRGVTHYVADGEIATPHSGGPVVVVLGDSHTEALQVDDPQKFASVAENLLWMKGKQLDLRNFGHSGASMANYVWLVRMFRERLHPVAFVIQLDEYDFDAHAFDPENSDHFVEKPDGRIELAHLPTPASPSRAQERLPQAELWNYARYRWNLLIDLGAHAQTGHLSTADSVAQEAELLRQAAGGVPVILLRLPYSPYSSIYFGERRDLAYQTFTALHRALPDWPLIDPSPEFLESRERGSDPRTFFNADPFGAHLNVDGHAIVGRLIAEELARMVQP